MIGNRKSYNRIPNFPMRAAAYSIALGVLASVIAVWTWPEVEPVVETVLFVFFPEFPEFDRAGAVLACFAVGALAGLRAAASEASRFHSGVWSGERPSRSALCGSARLLSSPRDLKRAFSVWKGGSPAPSGVVVGGLGATGSLLVSDITHMLAIGGTGAGKTTSFVLPTISLLAERDGACAVILDPKGECFALTAGLARRKGKRVVCIDFAEPALSDGWNPLRPAMDCAREERGRSRSEMAGELRAVAEALVPRRQESSPIWSQAARILLAGIAGYVVQSPDVPDDCRNLSTVAAIASMPQEELQGVVERLPQGSFARLQLEGVASAPPETFGGFRSNLHAYLEVYADPGVSGMLSRDGFRVEDFLGGDLFVFVRFSSASSAYDALVSAFVGQAVGGLRRLAERGREGTLPHPVYLLLEEFGQLPEVPGLPKHLSVVRSQGMHAVFVVQDRAQVTSVYGDEAPTVFANLDTTMFLASSDKETCRHYSEALGCYTVEAESTSRTDGGRSKSTGRSVGLREARLFRPEDLLAWGWRAGHLVMERGQAYACASVPVSRTFCGDEMGLGGKEPDASTLAELAPVRSEQEPDVAPVWDWRDGGGGLSEGIAEVLASTADPRWM